MKILHILDHSIPLHSGYTFRSRAILREQRALGWETDHLTSSKHQLEAGETPLEETIEDLHFFRTPVPEGQLSHLPLLNQWAIIEAMTHRLLEVIPEVKPDLLQVHSPALNGVAALRAGRKLGIPVLYECRAFWEDAAVDHGTSSEGGLRYRLTRALETYVFKRVDAVTTICEGLRQDILQRGIPAEKITVIPNAVDIQQFSVLEERDHELEQKLDLTGKTVLGFLGSFYAYEGLRLLLQAMPTLLRENPSLCVLLVGGGPEDERLKTQAERLQISNQVIFTGRVPHAEVGHYYSLVDILVYPRESMRLTDLVTPLKPLEAMAQGKLVLASDVGGHKELIEDGKTGYLFEAGSVPALATAIKRMLSQREQWPGIIQAGRRFVESERNWAVSVGRYCQIIGRHIRAG